MPSTEANRSRRGRQRAAGRSAPSRCPRRSRAARPRRPPPRAALKSSSRNSGLPPERSTRVASSCGQHRVVLGGGEQQRFAPPRRQAPSAAAPSRVEGRARRTRSPRSRRVTANSHGPAPTSSATRRSSDADASSIQWTSSISTSVGVSANTRARNSLTARSRRSRRNSWSSASTSGVWGISMSSGTASSGSHGSRSGRCVDATRSRSIAATSSSSVSSEIPMASRRTRRTGRYGVDASYELARRRHHREALRAIAQRLAGAGSCRCPGSPTISSSVRGPPARPQGRRSKAASSRRPADQRQLVGGPGLLGPGDGDPPRRHGPGSRLPFTMKGSSSVGLERHGGGVQDGGRRQRSARARPSP